MEIIQNVRGVISELGRKIGIDCRWNDRAIVIQDNSGRKCHIELLQSEGLLIVSLPLEHPKHKEYTHADILELNIDISFLKGTWAGYDWKSDCICLCKSTEVAILTADHIKDIILHLFHIEENLQKKISSTRRIGLGSAQKINRHVRY
ncbi:CesT family type III secretion system chaperone [Duganella violaceipulchra]|uniref:Type III secretion system chaperone n=1 Tax=Duganella violaceipulchra TaxID=2849652 RepID=A0AA41HES7_9BURK|nr:CesT family type III secretion system chaperone [Duganella violaceicalia]MBV6322433.1 type III secretion system chaperone [Duganella violaceicalia]MCP2010629.1 hypothetical protein [Duganella violaceicalia]